MILRGLHAAASFCVYRIKTCIFCLNVLNYENTDEKQRNRQVTHSEPETV